MSLLPGESLNSYLAKVERAPVALAVQVGREIAEGLQFAHEKRLLHRDIKPANIWLEERPSRPLRVRIPRFRFGSGPWRAPVP